ncbi:MAG: 5'-deoxynucleotidase [Clostridia bacterium]
MSKNGFFAFIHRMKYITRWGLMRNTSYENLKEHSFDVAVIAHGLAIIGNSYYGRNYNADRIAMCALFHDANEAITGDMPTPVKYGNPEIMKAYKELEAQAKKRILCMLPEELAPEYKSYMYIGDKDEKAVVKAADKISAYIKCIEEERAGNTDFSTAKKSLEKAIESYDMPEVKHFMKEFAPVYGLNVDEC